MGAQGWSLVPGRGVLGHMDSGLECDSLIQKVVRVMGSELVGLYREGTLAGYLSCLLSVGIN